MKKKVIYLVLIVIFLTGGFFAWKVFGPGLNPPPGKYFYISTGSNYAEVKKSLEDQQIIGSLAIFDLIAKQAKYPRSIRPGRYEIKKGMSLYNLVRMLRSGKQSPVDLVITKLRTVNDLAAKIAANFECDSAAMMGILDNPDSISKYGVDANTVMTAVIPNTYSILWNSSPSRIFRKLYSEKEKFWN